MDIHGLHTAVKSFPSTAPMCICASFASSAALLLRSSGRPSTPRSLQWLSVLMPPIRRPTWSKLHWRKPIEGTSLNTFVYFLAALVQYSYYPKVLSLNRPRIPITFLGSRHVSDIISGYYRNQIKPLGSTSRSAEICNWMQRHSDARFGVMSRCVQASNVVNYACTK